MAKSGNNGGKGWDKQLQRVGLKYNRNPVYSTSIKPRKVQLKKKKKTVYGLTVAKSGTNGCKECE